MDTGVEVLYRHRPFNAVSATKKRLGHGGKCPLGAALTSSHWQEQTYPNVQTCPTLT